MIWSQKNINLLLELYPNTNNKEIAAIMKISYSSVVNKAYYMRLKKSKEYLSSLPTEQLKIKGAKFHFKIGASPVNKGKKWKDFMSKEGMRNSRKTTFKKGNVPHNTKKDNEISIRKDKGGRIYKFIRIKSGKWIPLHVHNWQKQYGSIPKGKIVVFKNKNTDDCSVDKLELITKEENMRRNTIQRYPEEIKSTIKLISKLKKTIYGKEQNSRPA